MNETEQSRSRSANEGREAGHEAKEKQVEEAEKKMAAKERVEVVAREVKNTKQQIQKIIANMQQVVAAVAAIRAQLNLSSDGEIPSVARDEKNLEALKNKLSKLFGELTDLKKALLVEEQKAVREDFKDWNDEAVFAEAERRIRIVLQNLGLEEEV